MSDFSSSEIPNSSDCISRQLALDILNKCYAEIELDYGRPVNCYEGMFYTRLKMALSSAQPDFDMTEKIDKAHDDGYEQGYLQGKTDYERKTGKWVNEHWDGDSNFRIDGRGNCWFVRECSNCHEEIEGKPTKYCPNCGCRMLKEGE